MLGEIGNENQITVKDFHLYQNYPNPFNPSTEIKFSIPHYSFVTLKVYNTIGEEIATLINSELDTGTYNVSFEANNLSSGIYFYRMQTETFSETKKMILLR